MASIVFTSARHLLTMNLLLLVLTKTNKKKETEKTVNKQKIKTTCAGIGTHAHELARVSRLCVCRAERALTTGRPGDNWCPWS